MPQEQSRTSAPEQHVWTGRPSQVTNVKTFILCTLFCWLVIPIFVGFWRWLNTRSITYELTTQRLKISWGVLTRRNDEIELYRVKDSTFMQSTFERMFGLASINLISSDASSPSAMIYAIPAKEAKPLRENIRSLTEALRDRKRVREVDYN